MKSKSFLVSQFLALIISIAIISPAFSDESPEQKAELYLDASVVIFDESHVICDGHAWTLDAFIETNSVSPVCLLMNHSSNDSSALKNAWCQSHSQADGRTGIRILANLNRFPTPSKDEYFEMRFFVFQNGAKFYGVPELSI